VVIIFSPAAGGTQSSEATAVTTSTPKMAATSYGEVIVTQPSPMASSMTTCTSGSSSMEPDPTPKTTL
jgi:hypothetical protein